MLSDLLSKYIKSLHQLLLLSISWASIPSTFRHDAFVYVCTRSIHLSINKTQGLFHKVQFDMRTFYSAGGEIKTCIPWPKKMFRFETDQDTGPRVEKKSFWINLKPSFGKRNFFGNYAGNLRFVLLITVSIF